MKYFKKKVLKYCCIILGLVITGITVDIFKTHNTDYSIDKSIHTIIWGPSTTACSLNDSILDNTINLSKHGSSYTQTYLLLDLFLDNNPNIDTIIISFGRFHFFYFNDNQLFSDIKNHHIANTSMLLTISSYRYIVKKTLGDNSIYMDLVTQSLKQLIKNNDYSIDDYMLGYTALEHQNLFLDKQWSITWYDSTFGNIPYSVNWIKNNCNNSIKGINDILRLCEKYNVTPILFCTPLFEYERWCPKSIFIDFLKNNFSKTILIADYEDFRFPNTSYYGDVHHLNSKGANYFSSYIKEKGISAIQMKDYILSYQSDK